MTAEEAEILARNISVDCKHGIELGYPCECCVASALRAVRQEALEEAARAVERAIELSIPSSDLRHIVARIRALKESK